MPTNISGALRRIFIAPIPALLAQKTSDRKRRTIALPSVFTTGTRLPILPKPSPSNLRRFAETPVARKAINTVKDRVACMQWRIQPKNGRALQEIPHGEERVRILTDNLDSPNYDDSFRSLAEQVLEDVIVGGFGAAGQQLRGAIRVVVAGPDAGAARAADPLVAG